MNINNDIQVEKVNMFMDESAKKDSFFFRLTELIKLFGSLTLSQEEWKQYQDESLLQKNQLIEKIRVFST